MPSNKRTSFGTVEQRYVASASITSANQPCLIAISGSTVKRLTHIETSVFIADATRMAESIVYRVVVASGGIPDLNVPYEPFFGPLTAPDHLQNFQIHLDTLVLTQGRQQFDFATPIEVKMGDTLIVLATWVYSATGGFATPGPVSIQACLQRLSAYGREHEPTVEDRSWR